MLTKILHTGFAAMLFTSALFPLAAQAGDSLIPNGDFASGMDGWSLNRLEQTEATASPEAIEDGKRALHIKVPQAGAKRYYVQLVRNGLHLRSDKTYHLHFRAKSTPASEMVLLAATYHGKYNEMWRQEHVALNPEWADYTADFKPTATDDTAQVIFSGFAGQAGDYWLADISLEERD